MTFKDSMLFAMIALGTYKTLEKCFFETSTVQNPNFVELVRTYSGTGSWIFQTEQEGQMYHNGIHALSASYSLSLQVLLSLGYIFIIFTVQNC